MWNLEGETHSYDERDLSREQAARDVIIAQHSRSTIIELTKFTRNW